MLYTIGTAHELSLLPSHLPQELVLEILAGLVILDAEYGESRNYYESGGYSVIAETTEDIPGLKAIIDYEKHPCEWATEIGKTGYVSALYILNNDFSIMVYLPQASPRKKSSMNWRINYGNNYDHPHHRGHLQ